MKGWLFRKMALAIIMIVPLLSSPGCKKQARCGCGKDVLYTLTDADARVYFNSDTTSISFTLLNDNYSTYHFCNPTEMASEFRDYDQTKDIIQISGNVYWDCTYLSQASSSYSYQYYYTKIYQVQVTDVNLNLYGKK